MKFNKVLIANRGEIAVRIAQACQKMGLASVAVYSEADAGALHTQVADEAVLIGPAAARLSYLNIPAVLAAAQASGAQAVHPGYGFLAENAEFAQAILDAGLVWVGPPPAAMRAMGDKASARERMLQAGVPVLPGYQGPDSTGELEAAAAALGYPLLVKAAAGGGGVGQRVVHAAAELPEAIAAARREAASAFGDERLMLEKYLATARHVEVQVLGDQHGKLLHLFERECSLQRRRQKIVEETPSPLIDGALREAMCAAATAAAAAVDYTNAGTVEFLVDPATGEFYFLEMNTRLQVEHPVTELTTGIDIVEWQLRIAAGEPLTVQQAHVRQHGHAIECRIYAEDPSAGFLPQAGEVLRLQWPLAARVDAGIAEGSQVSVHYDPMLAKLSVHADDRQSAITAMQAALADTVLLGVINNIDFLQAVLADPQMAFGDFDTQTIERAFAAWQPPLLPPEALLAAAALELQPTEGPPSAADPYSPWATASGFRMGRGGVL
ncbi:MAG TPA: biotin carboxylase N-terminal domain-containing protein [Anaerolineales bacterium]|nr:biotin carboxylase N-terminal domain-containing protein [Anaerolineales bacterium]HRQ92555.1 biotin carboxylase N-terminal domain-containing protein [Anaerolineales bacterium]